ncbi:hypothetical protein M885DRAFT_506595 [Pelagophyceae sp. CCMP2097]|nr:hypothetical protein M885DRAFT_506595 [Pelagophyceae sp. CCMP2097]
MLAEDSHLEIRRELSHALAYLERGDYALAEDCYAAALEQAGNLRDAKLMSTILGYLARATAAQGKHKLAATMYERQLHMLEGSLAGSPTDRVSIMLELISLYNKLGREDDAAALNGEVEVLMAHLVEPVVDDVESSSEEESDDESDDEDEGDAVRPLGILGEADETTDE